MTKDQTDNFQSQQHSLLNALHRSNPSGTKKTLLAPSFLTNPTSLSYFELSPIVAHPHTQVFLPSYTHHFFRRLINSNFANYRKISNFEVSNTIIHFLC